MPSIDFDTAKKINSLLTKTHHEWGPRAAPFRTREGALGHFVSKITFALNGAEPDYISVELEHGGFRVFIVAGENMYVASATAESSEVVIRPFAVDSVIVKDTENVLQSPANWEFGRLSVEVSFDDVTLTLPGHNNDENESALDSFLPTLVEHLKRPVKTS